MTKYFSTQILYCQISVQVNCLSSPPLVPLSLTTQVHDQCRSTGHLPERSDLEEPAVVAPGETPVITWLVLGLPFLATF